MRFSAFPACVVCALLLSATPLLADGGGHGHDLDAAVVGAPGDAAKADRTIEIVLGDNFFKPDILDVKPGETVRFVLVNKGDFLHEFNIGTPAMHEEHRAEMLAMMQSGMLTPTGMNHDMSHDDMPGMAMPATAMKHDDPNAVLVEPGQTKELVWTFPAGSKKSAGLEFSCNMPGHAESGMVGPIHIGA
ncbi:MAG: plastocyanin/azurin family copper-binding protein [Parvibaculaceae bacterium]|nr:plastocyanin/azurin family copper-binding protein [Parvibaculaceae bacterium]